MAPTAISWPALSKPGPAPDLPPPKLYPVKETKFEKPSPVQQDGREKALQQPEGSAAIIIDNGVAPIFPPSNPLIIYAHSSRVAPN